MFFFTAAFILLPALQVNPVTDPLGSVLEKYGPIGFFAVVMTFAVRYLIIAQNKQAEDYRRQEKELKERQDLRDTENDTRLQEMQDRHDKLQNEVRLQLSEQTSESKEREITLLKELRENAKLVAKLQVEVAVLQEQAKNYDDRIGFLKLQLQVKQSDFDAAASERKALEEHVGRLSSELSVLNQAYQSLREQHDLLVIEKNAIKNTVVEMKRDTQTIPAVPNDNLPTTLPVSGTLELTTSTNPT